MWELVPTGFSASEGVYAGSDRAVADFGQAGLAPVPAAAADVAPMVAVLERSKNSAVSCPGRRDSREVYSISIGPEPRREGTEANQLWKIRGSRLRESPCTEFPFSYFLDATQYTAFVTCARLEPSNFPAGFTTQKGPNLDKGALDSDATHRSDVPKRACTWR